MFEFAFKKLCFIIESEAGSVGCGLWTVASTRGGEWRSVTHTYFGPTPIGYWINFNQHINNLAYKRIPAACNIMPHINKWVPILITMYAYEYVSVHINAPHQEWDCSFTPTCIDLHMAPSMSSRLHLHIRKLANT